MVGTFVMEFAVPQMATILASAGADYLIVDLEHTMFSLQTVGSMIRAARGSDIPAIVRIPSIDRHFVSRSLDAGAAGLMQLMPITAKELGVTDRFDPEQNIESGTRYLRRLLDRFGSTELALWAYNAGPSAVEAGRMPLETQEYVPRVLLLQNYFSNEIR